MSLVAELLCSRRLPHVAALALISFGFAGCSSDMTTRFAQDGGTPGQSTQFGWQRETTGSVAAPAPQVERRELPQYSRPQTQISAIAAADRRTPVLPGGPARPEAGAGFPPTRPRRSRRSKPPGRYRHARSRRFALRRRHRLKPAPKSSSAPAIRWRACRATTMFRRQRSCRPTATKGPARCRPANS